MRLILSLILIQFLLINTGCNKENDIVQQPITHEDTLGRGWTKISFTESLYFNEGDIYFVDQNLGFVAREYLYKSTDGGLTWSNTRYYGGISLSGTADNKLFHIQQGIIDKSTDNGVTFSQYSVPGSARSILFANNNNGYCVTNQSLLGTTDGGSSWVNIANPPILNELREDKSVASKGNFTCVAYGIYLYYSNDNNATWTFDSIPEPVSDLSISSISAPSETKIFISSVTGYLFKSVNGGRSFSFVQKLESNRNPASHSDLHFINENLGYMSLDNRIYKTIDGGSNWTMELALGTKAILEIYFTDANHGWALCNDGSILRYVN